MPLLCCKTEFLLSKEGVGQGDPLSMLMYVAAVVSLIKSLSIPSNWIQNWYANDSSCTAKLTHLRDCFDKLYEHGPKYGYHPEVDKCIVIVDSNHEHLGVKVVKGYRFLGDFIGDHDSTKAFIQKKIVELTNSVVKLSKLAESQPQAAFSALAKSLQFEWSYLQRILPNFDDEYVPIQDAVNQMFWPAVFAGTISNQEHHLFTLPARMGVWESATQLKLQSRFCNIQSWHIKHRRCYQGLQAVFYIGSLHPNV